MADTHGRDRLAENIRISPSTAKIHEPITFELTGCSSCENIVWVFTKIGDPSVGNGGDGYTVTIPFPIAGRYRARVTGTQAFGAYSHYVTAMKEFTVTATPFTITILPREGGIVRGGIGQEDGIECSLGLSSNFCTETYLIGQNAHLKVIPNPGWFFLGWMLNDLPVKNAGVHQVDIDKMSLIKDIPQWIGWEDALSSYRSTNEESEYAQKVMAIYKSGKNPHTIYSKKERKNIPIKPHYLWPVMTDGFSRDSGFSKKEKAYLRWVLRKNAQQN